MCSSSTVRSRSPLSYKQYDNNTNRRLYNNNNTNRKYENNDTKNNRSPYYTSVVVGNLANNNNTNRYDNYY